MRRVFFLPIAAASAILATSSVLGPEVDDGSIVYLLSKPVNRDGIAIS